MNDETDVEVQNSVFDTQVIQEVARRYADSVQAMMEGGPIFRIPDGPPTEQATTSPRRSSYQRMGSIVEYSVQADASHPASDATIPQPPTPEQLRVAIQEMGQATAKKHSMTYLNLEEFKKYVDYMLSALDLEPTDADGMIRQAESGGYTLTKAWANEYLLDKKRQKTALNTNVFGTDPTWKARLLTMQYNSAIDHARLFKKHEKLMDKAALYRRKADNITREAADYFRTFQLCLNNRSTNLIEQIEKICEGGFFSIEYVTREMIRFKTARVTIAERNDAAGINRTCKMGVYLVDYYHESSTMRVLPFHDNLYYRDYYHPHVDTSGSICWGNASHAVTKLVEGDLVPAFAALEVILKTYNGESPFKPLDYFIQMRENRQRITHLSQEWIQKGRIKASAENAIAPLEDLQPYRKMRDGTLYLHTYLYCLVDASFSPVPDPHNVTPRYCLKLKNDLYIPVDVGFKQWTDENGNENYPEQQHDEDEDSDGDEDDSDNDDGAYF